MKNGGTIKIERPERRIIDLKPGESGWCSLSSISGEVVLTKNYIHFSYESELFDIDPTDESNGFDYGFDTVIYIERKNSGKSEDSFNIHILISGNIVVFHLIRENDVRYSDEYLSVDLKKFNVEYITYSTIEELEELAEIKKRENSDPYFGISTSELEKMLSTSKNVKSDEIQNIINEIIRRKANK